MDMERDVEDLLKKLELENGAPVRWRTYAFYQVSGKGQKGTIGGLLYIAGNSLIFEDFEPEKSMYSLFSPRKQQYTKFKIEADLDSIQTIRATTPSVALQVLEGKQSARNLPSLTKLQRIFQRTIYMIHFKDDNVWFCEIFDIAGLKNIIKEHV